MANTIKVNGRAVEYVNAYSYGPGCTPHSYELRDGTRVRTAPVGGSGWIRQGRGVGEWIPEISGFAIRLSSVDRVSP